MAQSLSAPSSSKASANKRSSRHVRGTSAYPLPTCDIMGKAGNVSGRPEGDIGDVERLVGDREFRFDEWAIYPLTA